MSQWTGQSAQGTGLRKRDSSGIGDLLVLHDEMFHGDPKDERVPAQGGGERRPEVTVNVNSRPMAQPAEHSAQASERQGALFGASSDGTSILRKVEQEEDFSSRLRKRLEDACESSPDRSITSMSHEFGAQNSQIIQGWRPPSSARDQKGLGLSPPKPEPPVRPEPSESPPLREPAVSAAAAIPAVVVAQEPPGGNVLSGSGEPHASAGEKMERATAGMSGASGISLQASDLQLTAAGESVEPSKVGLEQLPLEHEPERSRFQPQAPEALEAPKAPKASEAPVRLESGESLDDTVAPEGNTVSVSLLRPQSPAESLPVDAEVDHHAPETTPSPSSILNSPSPSGKNPGKKKNRLMLQLPGAMPQPMVRDSVRQVQLTVSAAFGESDAKGTDLGPAVLDGNRKKQKAQMRSLHLQGVDEEQCADELATDVLEDGPGTSAEEPPLKSILKKSQDGKGGAKLSLRTTTMMAGLAARGRRGSSQVVPMEEMELPPSKTVRIVDNTDEMKAKRRSQREFEWKERQQKIHSQRRMKALGSMLRTPIGLAIYLGKCYLASPKARQVWLVAILSVCLFELWSAALFIAFVLDPSKANFLSTLLSMDHYANLVFIIDAMFLALNQLDGEGQEMGDRSGSQAHLHQRVKQIMIRLPGFSSCSSELLIELIQAGQLKVVQKGQNLVDDDGYSTSFYLVLDGEVSVTEGDSMPQYFGEGTCFGEFQVFGIQETVQTRAEAVTLAEVFEIPAEAMLKCMEGSPADCNVFMEGLKAKYMEVRASMSMSQDLQQQKQKNFRAFWKTLATASRMGQQIFVQTLLAVLLWVWGTVVQNSLDARLLNPHVERNDAVDNVGMIIFLMLKLLRQQLPLRYIKRFFAERETQLYVNIRLKGTSASTWVTVKLAVIMLGWGHWVGCLSFALALVRSNTSSRERSSFEQFQEVTHLKAYARHEWWGDYMAAYYHAFNVNLEGMIPERVEELVFAVFICIGLLVMKSYVIGSFFKLQQAQKELAMEVSNLMNKADLVCTVLDLPPSIRKSIRQYCLFQRSKAKDVGNHEVVMKTFQPDLQRKVRELVYLPVLLANQKMFTGVSTEFTQQLTDQLEVVMLLPSEVLFVENDAPQDVSFLESGTLMLTRQEQLIRYVRSDRPNETTVVGEVSFLLEVPHLYSVRSRAGVESTVLRVSRKEFDNVVRHLDSDLDQLMQNAAQSMNLTLNGTDIKRETHQNEHEDTELYVQMRESVCVKLLKRTAHMSSAFIHAAAEGNIDLVELLLRKRIDVNIANCDGRTAMHLAAAEGREGVMKVLIEAEGNVNLQDRWKGSPLKDAVLGKFAAVTELLLEQQADLNLDDPATALCDAASSGNLLALKELIEVKINPNSGDYDLRTPLHLAASEGKLEVISFLLDSHANPNFKDRWGGMALEDAIQNNHSVAAQLIFSKRGSLRQELAAGWLCDAASAGNIVKLQQLAENSVDVNLADYDARTALHLAATEGQLLAVSFLLGTARANTSPQDRWLSTPLQDAIRAGHTDCARLLAFSGATLGDSATDEDRQLLRKVYSEDLASCEWEAVQVFQRKMTELQQRVARLLLAVMKGRARPEVFDAEASANFNRQLIGAVLKQCPQLADQMVKILKLLKGLQVQGVAPMHSFLGLLQDGITCTQQGKWWAWHSKKAKDSRRKGGTKEAKLDKSTGMVTKMMVQTMGICSALAAVMNKAAVLILERVNQVVKSRYLETKTYVIDDEYLASLRDKKKLPSASSKRSRRFGDGGAASVRSGKSHKSAKSGKSARSARTQESANVEETEDPRESRDSLSVICTEAIFEALEWEVDWTAPSSSNYGINAGPLKKKLDELAKILAGTQTGAIPEALETVLHTPVELAEKSMRQGACSKEAAEIVERARRNHLCPLSGPLANELAILTILALVQAAPMNLDCQPSNEKTLQRIDICVLRSGLEVATAEVKGDIAKARKEMMKQGRTQRKPGKKWLVGGRFGNQNMEPVTIGKILSTQKDLPPSDICALLDFQDPTVQSSLDRGGDDSDEEARKRADKPKHRRKEDVHILPHKPTFGSMSTLRFQLNVLRYVLDFQSLQEEAIQEEELRLEERQREITEDGENCTELLTSGEVVTFDPDYYDGVEELSENSEESSSSSETSSSEESKDHSGSSQDTTKEVAKSQTLRGFKGGGRTKRILAAGAAASSFFSMFRGSEEAQRARMRARVARRFRELDEDGEGIQLADVATLLTDVLGRQLDRDAMLRLAANVFDNAEKNEQELLQLPEVLKSLDSVATDFNALVKRRQQHSSGQTGEEETSWTCVRRLAGMVIPPDSPWLKAWDLFRQLAVVYFMLEIPMRFAFINFDQLPQNDARVLLAINLCMDIFMLLSMMLTFLRGYTKSSGVTVIDFHQIRVRYMLSTFSWDILACFPLDLLVAGFQASRDYATWRLFKLVHLRHFWSDSRPSQGKEGGFLVTTVRIMLQVYVLLHFTACGFWYISNGWPTEQELLEQQNVASEATGWFRRYDGMGFAAGLFNQAHVPVFEQYMICLWAMMCLLTNDSHYEISSTTWLELGWVIASFVVSIAVTGHIDGALVGKVTSQDQSTVEDRVMRARVDNFIQNAGLPVELAEQIRLSTDAGHSASRGSKAEKSTATDIRTMESVLQTLSRGLLTRVGRRVFLKWLQGVQLFKGCSEPFLLQLATRCRQITLSPGSFICRVGEPSSFLVILRYGSVQIRDTSNEEIDRAEEKGTAFCDISCMFGLRHKTSIICEEETQLIKLQVEDLNFALELYPKDREKINNNVLEIMPETADLTEQENDGAAMGAIAMPMIANITMSGMGDDHDDGRQSLDRRKLRAMGKVDLVADLSIHDLNLEGVAHVRNVINKMLEEKAQQRVSDFMEFAANGKWEKMEAMLKDREVTVDSKNWDSRTALHVAVSEGHLNVVERLVSDWSATLTLEDRFGNTALDDAVRERRAEVAEFLVEASAEFKGGVAAAVQLCEAAAEGDTSQLELLVEVIGVDPNLGDYDNRTALHLAASNGHLETITRMLEFGYLDLSPLDRFGQTPLDDAIRHEHVAVQKLLKSEGAQMGSVEFGVALCEAAANNDTDKIRQMIEAGVRAGMADYDYRTALHLASSNGHLETCVFLLREGRVDPNPLDRFLNTPLDDAIRHGHKDIVELLMKYKGRPSDDDEYLSTVRDDFLKKMEEEKTRKDTDKLEKELKTHRLSDVMDRLSRLASDMEDDIHNFKTAASNIRYALCRILHMSMFLQDDSSRSRAGYDKLAQDMEEGNLTSQKLIPLMERDLKQLDSSASRILKHIAGELQPWLHAATNNSHTRGLVRLLMPNFSQDLSNLISGVNHVKALLPRLVSQLVTPAGLGYDCRAFGLLYQRFSSRRCGDVQEILQSALQLLCVTSFGKQEAAWPSKPRAREAANLFKESNVTNSLTYSIERPPFKPPAEFLKQNALQDIESV